MFNYKKHIVIALIFISFSVQAQTSTLFLIGDSTMSDKKNPEVNPEHGWGQVLPEFLTDEIKVENHSVNGRSTKSFIDEGRWKAVLEKLQPGDFVFIQFGHNDQKIKNKDRFTNPFTGYRRNLEKYVKETREKGAKPVLFTSIVRRNFNEHGVLVDTHGDYPLVVRMVADHLDVPFVDLQSLTEQLELFYGEVDSKRLHLHFLPSEIDYYPEGKADDTHLSETGAKLVASLALRELSGMESKFKSLIKKSQLMEEIQNINK